MAKPLHKDKDESRNLKLQRRLGHGRSIVGIDIGSSSINLAQMVNHKGKRVLVQTRIVDITSTPGQDHDEATLMALHAALKDFDRRDNTYVCVVNCPQTYVRKITTPSMPQEDLHGAVSLEAKRSIPIALEDAVLDYNVTEEIVDKGVEKLNIVVAVSPRKTIEKILSFFIPKKAKPFAGSLSKKTNTEKKLEPLNLKIATLLPLSLCLENIIEQSKLKISETLVTIEIGTIVTELNIYKDAKLQFSRKIPFSGDQITKSLTETLMTDKGKVELTLEEAEAVKKEYGIPNIEQNKEVNNKITTNQILSLIRPRIEQLANEIERSFDFYREEMHGGKVDRIVLFGGGAQLKGLPEFLSKELGLEVSVGNPLADIHVVSNDVVSHEGDAHRLVLAIGAALSGMKGINLLPLEMREQTKRSVKKAAVSLGVAAAVALFLITFFPLQSKVNNLENRLRTLHKEMSALYPVLKNVNERVMVHQLLSAQPYWDETLKEISNVIPAKMHLHNITAQKDSFNIEGTVETGEQPAEIALSEFMISLENGLFKNVQLVKTVKNTQGPGRIDFELNCRTE